MNLHWLSSSDIPKELSLLKENKPNININQSLDTKLNKDDAISIIPIADVIKNANYNKDYLIWLGDQDLISSNFYRDQKQSAHFLGTLGSFLSLKQTYSILRSTQDRQVKNLRQAEIIQRAKSQNLLIENQVKNLNSEVEDKTRQLYQYKDQLEAQVSFEKESILILKNLLEASSFESFDQVLVDSFKKFFVKNLVIFYRDSGEQYKIRSKYSRHNKNSFSDEQIAKIDKTFWANIISRPVLEFKLFSIGTTAEYYIGFEFSNFDHNAQVGIQKYINYLQYIFKMVLDYLFDQEKIIRDSLLWSTSFDSLDDPLLIIDEYYKIVKSNIDPGLKGQNCFKVLFERDRPCEKCPIKQTLGQEENADETVNVNLDDKYNLHSFQVDVDRNLEQRLWIHHYVSTESINDLRAQYIKAEKFSYLGQLVDKVIHQIANPLTGMRASVDFMLLESGSSEALNEDLVEIQSGLLRCFDIINNLKDFSGAEVNLTSTDLSSFVSKTLTLMKSVTKDIRFELVNLENKTITCPTGLVQQVLFNIIYNSCQAMCFSGSIKISAEQDNNYTNLSVWDSGPGIPKEIEDKIFDPFFSTKLEDQGTGIGLFLSRQIIRQFGGDIVVMNSLKPGAQLCIKFPVGVK